MRRIHLAAALLPLLAAPALAQTTLRIGIGADPNVLDPGQSGSFVERVVFSALCDKLIDVGPDLQFRAELATAWEWAADGRALTWSMPVPYGSCSASPSRRCYPCSRIARA